MNETSQVHGAWTSQTPRTDAAELDQAHFADWGCGPSGYVEIDFARELERELAAARIAISEASSVGFRAACKAAAEIVSAETDGDSPFDGTIAMMVYKIEHLVPPTTPSSFNNTKEK